MMPSPPEQAAWRYMALTVATAGTPQLAAFIGTATTVATEDDLALAVIGQVAATGAAAAADDTIVAFGDDALATRGAADAVEGLPAENSTANVV
jgi:hypothetical protein